MNDRKIIYADDAINAITNYAKFLWNNFHETCNLAGMIDAIETLPSADQWIPVSERLSEEEKNVLVTVFFHGLTTKHKTGWNDHIKPKRYVEVANYFDGNWYSYSDEYKVAKNRHEVMAWMPLPEPWKGEENG